MKKTLLFLAAITAWSTIQVSAFYNPSTGRWLSRDPIGEKGGLNLYGFVANDPVSKWDSLGQFTPGHLEPIPGRPGHFRLVPSPDSVEVGRCNIDILAGHTRHLPGKLTVATANKGCAYGEAYGCGTGGGEIDLDGQLVRVPKWQTPGIPGAPSGPTDFIDDDEMRSLVSRAFEAAKAAAPEMCKKCCCKTVSISTQVFVSDAEEKSVNPADRAIIDWLNAQHTQIQCNR